MSTNTTTAPAAGTTPAPDPNVFALKGRLSYAHLFKKHAMEGNEPKFQATIIMDKEGDKDQIEALKKRIKELIVEMKLTTLPPDKIPLRDGAYKDKEGYGESTVYVAASNDKKPQVVDQKRQPMDQDDPRVYSGVYGKLLIRLWKQDNGYGKRVNASLEGFQYLRTGEALGQAPIKTDLYLTDEPDEGEAAGSPASNGLL